VSGSRVKVKRRTEWLGNGFGSSTVHYALLDGALVGEWSRGSLWAWAGEQRRSTGLWSYREWLATVRQIESLPEDRSL
jgi:hypothetical protein